MLIVDHNGNIIILLTNESDAEHVELDRFSHDEILALFLCPVNSRINNNNNDKKKNRLITSH